MTEKVTMIARICVIAAALAAGLSPVWAGDMEPMSGMDAAGNDKAKMENGAMPGMQMPAAKQKAGAPAGAPSGDKSTMKQDAGMDGPMSMQGGSAPPDARDPRAYSGGEDFGPIPPPRMGDREARAALLIDRLEAVHTGGNASAAYDMQAWFGRDYDRAVVKAEGDVDRGVSQDAQTELLWSHSVSTYWDTQLGARYDSGIGPNRRWLAFGIQGLAPYWFNVDATAYVGDSGRAALQVKAEYDLLLTQKLILQPRFETNFYSKRDAARALGSGLSDLNVGVRLRYEIRREFAPYIGIEWAGKFGGTADYLAAGQGNSDTRVVAGLRLWY